MIRKYLITAYELMLLIAVPKHLRHSSPRLRQIQKIRRFPLQSTCEKTISGTISDINNVMFILNDGKNSPSF